MALEKKIPRIRIKRITKHSLCMDLVDVSRGMAADTVDIILYNWKPSDSTSLA